MSAHDWPGNLAVYSRPEVAGHYARLDYLSPCEAHLFRKYLRPGINLLDIGVGGGRTSRYLSELASTYVGIDYSPQMVLECRQRFPNLDFRQRDATDLSCFDDASFTAVVIAFNGLDYLSPEGRACCLAECHRVLDEDGILIFSSHNPRSLLVRHDWNRERVLTMSRAFGRGVPLRLVTVAVTLAAATRAVLRSSWASLQRVRRLPTRAFWSGRGYVFDPAHGGLSTYCSVPRLVWDEVRSAGFQMLESLGDEYPRKTGEFMTDWYYYACRKANTTASQPAEAIQAAAGGQG